MSLTELALSMAAGALALAVLWRLAGRRLADRLAAGSAAGYGARAALLSEAERHFFETLTAALATEPYGADLVVCCQVRLADLVRVEGEAGSRAWWRAFRAVSQKHVDFVLCERARFAILCVIELQDLSHVTDRRRRARDAEVRAVLAQAGIPLLEIPVQARYDRIALMLAIRQALDATKPVQAKPVAG